MPRRSISPLPSDPLEQARRFASDAKDIARDERRRLPEYDADTDEVTANVHVTVNMPQPSPSHPDGRIESETSVELHGVKVTGLPRWVIAGLVMLTAALTAFIATRVGGH